MIFWSRQSSPRRLLSPAERQALAAAVHGAEAGTSGEIRVHIERRCRIDALERARHVFHRLGMEKTARRNGVLIYVALVDRKFAIYGDEGIHRQVGDTWWQSIRDGLAARFGRGEFGAGLGEAVERVGSALKASFPVQPGDVNELPDEPSFGA